MVVIVVVVVVVVVIVDVVLVVVLDVVLFAVVAVLDEDLVDATVILWALDVKDDVVSVTDGPSLEVTDSDINIDSGSGEDDKDSVKPSTELPFCSVSLTFCLLGIILFR